MGRQSKNKKPWTVPAKGPRAKYYPQSVRVGKNYWRVLRPDYQRSSRVRRVKLEDLPEDSKLREWAEEEE